MPQPSRQHDGAMNVLGLSFGFHDAAAALVVDGRVVAAGQEERFTRRKHDAGFPAKAVEFCLRQGGVKISEIDRVVFHEDTGLKFDRLARSALSRGRGGIAFLSKACQHWVSDGKFFPKALISERLGLPRRRISSTRHHAAHAASAFFCSPFDRAVVLTIDGIGEEETFTVSIGEGTRLTKIAAVRFPHSLGLFYSAFTSYLGFEVNEGEYKVMGMAGFGEPVCWKELFALFDLSRPLDFRLRQEWFNFYDPEDHMYSGAMVDRFGPARVPETPFALGCAAGSVLSPENRRFADLAASVQRATEEVMLGLVRQAVERTGARRVCLAGGVALNSVANARIQSELGVEIYVHPAAGDSGCAVGAALGAAFAGTDRAHSPRTPLDHAYLGPEFSPAEVRAALEVAGIRRYRTYDDSAALVDTVAERLARHRVIGWMQGREEWGPRALGNRSILASPATAAMQALVNEKIKFREPFRPFAPSILMEHAAECFACPAELSPHAPECFMLAVRAATAAARARMPAVVHADGSSRVHTVRRDSNPLFYDLIAQFHRRTGIPALLNTSFNLRGQPVVGAPADAIETFGYSGIDTLVMGSYLIDKEDLV
ncbi:MAG: hypothetical protein IPL39_09220 [Opitutaceae bacterium]|nr:hypothetical protein [Opitutaceae bacterium]